MCIVTVVWDFVLGRVLGRGGIPFSAFSIRRSAERYATATDRTESDPYRACSFTQLPELEWVSSESLGHQNMRMFIF
ncbi:hypothetical protein TREES_T100010105 [Tupaia chinensis]|uniref:Uncharacterized protein n=1 Tax=Tupaia chinensis TaxID=246437 RepID=L9JBQ9_TUPCH|nr:hypothetical protein TREES_T100010105 [Tupaia chinensis]